MSAKKKTAKRKIEVVFSTKERQWNKPQAACLEAVKAIGKLAEEMKAEGKTLQAVDVRMKIRLDVPGSEFQVSVTEA